MKQLVKKINFSKVAQLLVATMLVFAPLLVANVAGAQGTIGDNFQCLPGQNCDVQGDVNSLIRTVINWLLGIAFGIAVLFLVIGGFWYITSAGNEETAEKGKNTAINAIIGIVIIILSYVIVNVVANLVTNTGVSGGGP